MLEGRSRPRSDFRLASSTRLSEFSWGTRPVGTPGQAPWLYGTVMPAAGGGAVRRPSGLLVGFAGRGDRPMPGDLGLEVAEACPLQAPVQVHLGDGDRAPVLRLGDDL